MTAYFQKRSRLHSCAILLLLSFLTLCITGCKNTSGTPEEHSFSTEDTNEKSYEYTIILPSDASAELVGFVRKLFAENGVIWQTAELGKVDMGGGGTVAQYIANQNIETVDLGVPVISMHAPYEVVSKADVYSTYEAFCAFVK